MATVPVPYSPPFQKISQRKINVAMKIGNRQDLLQSAPGSGFTYSRISGWLRDAYIAVATVRSFEQSEFTYQFQTVQGTDTYPLPVPVRALKSIEGYDQAGTPIQVDWKDISYIRRYNTSSGQGRAFQARPSIYTLWNNQILFRPTPDDSYNFFLDYWQRPLISPDVDGTLLLIPDEWLEIVDYEAAVRGNAELLQDDKSKSIQTLLYGFADMQSGKFTPGLVERMQNRQQAMAPYTDWGVQPPYQEGFTR